MKEKKCRMALRVTGMIAASLGVAVILAGCSVEKPSSQVSNASTSVQQKSEKVQATVQNSFETVTANEEGNVVIDGSSFSDVASYFSYDAQGVTVQMIGIRASDGTARLAMNTCQSCNPSPNAYYVQQGDSLVCRNCGQKFSADDVDHASGGCNPMLIDGMVQEGDTFIIPAESLDAYSALFKTWKGPVS